MNFFWVLLIVLAIAALVVGVRMYLADKRNKALQKAIRRAELDARLEKQRLAAHAKLKSDKVLRDKAIEGLRSIAETKSQTRGSRKSKPTSGSSIRSTVSKSSGYSDNSAASIAVMSSVATTSSYDYGSSSSSYDSGSSFSDSGSSSSF